VLIASMFSMMSARRCAGFLEGMNCIAQYIGLEQRLQCPAIHDIDWNIEESVDVELQSGVLENAYRALLIEFYQDVNIASRAGFAARHGAEDRGVRDSKPPQIAFVRAEYFEDGLEIHAHLPSRVYQTIGEVRMCMEAGSTGRECQRRRRAELLVLILAHPAGEAVSDRRPGRHCQSVDQTQLREKPKLVPKTKVSGAPQLMIRCRILVPLNAWSVTSLAVLSWHPNPERSRNGNPSALAALRFLSLRNKSTTG
jgi:hypothetical protein